MDRKSITDILVSVLIAIPVSLLLFYLMGNMHKENLQGEFDEHKREIFQHLEKFSSEVLEIKKDMESLHLSIGSRNEEQKQHATTDLNITSNTAKPMAEVKATPKPSALSDSTTNAPKIVEGNPEVDSSVNSGVPGAPAPGINNSIEPSEAYNNHLITSEATGRNEATGS